MTGKSFFAANTVDDILHLLYCTLVVNNDDLFMTYKTFLQFIEDKKILNWLEREYKKVSDYNAQIKVDTEEKTEESEEKEPPRMTEIASTLIMTYHIDAHYVMYEMELWEIPMYFEMGAEIAKKDLIEKRFWTYIQILPQIDGKKIKSPRQLIPFEWEEKEIKANAEKQMKNNMTAIKANIGRTLDI